jgi:hypothetical protein
MQAQNIQDYVIKKIIEYMEDPELIKLKKKLEQKKQKKLDLESKRKKWIDEFTDCFIGYSPLYEEYPVFCKECRSKSYFIESYNDDIDIVCGKCNHTAGVLPGYGYDPKTGRRLPGDQEKILDLKRRKAKFDEIPFLSKELKFEDFPEKCTHCSKAYLIHGYVFEDEPNKIRCGQCDEIVLPAV